MLIDIGDGASVEVRPVGGDLASVTVHFDDGFACDGWIEEGRLTRCILNAVPGWRVWVERVEHGVAEALGDERQCTR